MAGVFFALVFSVFDQNWAVSPSFHLSNDGLVYLQTSTLSNLTCSLLTASSQVYIFTTISGQGKSSSLGRWQLA
jgi:hypothetical protein